MKRKADSAITLPTVARADDTASANGGERGHTTLETAKQRFAQPPVPIPVAPFALAAGLGRGSTRAIKKGDLDLLYVRGFLSPGTAKKLYSWCLEALPWYSVRYDIRETHITTPRYTTVFGLDDASAANPRSRASDFTRAPRRIPGTLQELTDAVSALTGAQYNFTLCNLYLSGNNHISYHSDDERFLGPLPTIASLSLGGTRDFLLKHKKDPARRERFPLESGDLIVMRGTTQSNWLHSVPKRAQAQPRINITFRRGRSKACTENYYRYNVGDHQPMQLVNGVMRDSGISGLQDEHRKFPAVPLAACCDS